MKRVIFVTVMVFCLLLCACGDIEQTRQAQAPESTQEPTTESTQASTTEATTDPTGETTEKEPEEAIFNSAYVPYEADYKNLAVLINEPFKEELTPTVTWNEGEYDRLYIIPRYVGSRVEVYEMLWDEDGNMTYAAEPTYSTVAEDGCIIYASLLRPEGMPRWYVEIVAPNGRIGGLELTYNGNTGTPAKEYVSFDIHSVMAEKPVIYLYPETETEVTVELNYQGQLTCTYPAYNGGWTVTAQPDGTLTDASGQTYNYLYWEGKGSADYDFSRGFCVKGEDTAAFLETALAKLGLTRKEANEFIVYWLPMMQENPYNIIAFQTDCYTDSAPLSITPAPDTLLRVYMAWYGSETEIFLPEQTLAAPERSGFTVVEWGGCEVK